MGIKFYCPNGHKLNVKSFLAGKRGICPHCGAKVDIPGEEGSQTPAAPAAAASPELATLPTASVAHPLPSRGEIAAPSPAHAAPASPAALPAAGAPAVAEYQARVPVAAFPTPTAATPVAVAPVNAARAPSDPIAEAPDAVWYVRPPAGGQYGPASGDVLRSWISEGRVSADSLVWREGWHDWKSAGPLFPSLMALPTPGSPTATTPATSLIDGEAASGTRARYRTRRRQPTELTIGLIIMLIIAAMVLFGALIYVINL